MVFGKVEDRLPFQTLVLSFFPRKMRKLTTAYILFFASWIILRWFSGDRFLIVQSLNSSGL
jgi:hypothetical protein